MKRILLSLLLSGAISLVGYAQQSVSIGTDQINSNAVLWLQGNGSQGFILPVITNKSNVTATKGMVVFDDSDKKVYYNNGTIWVEVGGGGDGVAQTLSLSGNTLSISSGNSVQIANVNPSTAGQILQWDAGNSRWTSSTPTFPSIGQVLKWNGTTWTPSQDDVGTGSVPTLSNGQILIGDGNSNSAFLLSGDATLTGGVLTIEPNAINSSKILDGSVTSADIADGSIQSADLNSMGATNGQVLQFNGTLWNPATLATGSGTVTNVSGNGPISVTTPTTTPVISISQANGTTNGFLLSTDWAAFNAKLGIASTTGGDLSGTVVNPTVIAIQGRAVASTVPTNGQILKFNGTSWAPAADDVGGGATPTLSNGQILIGDGSSNSGVALSGDATLSAGALTIANNAINSAKIADGSIVNADINAAAAIAGSKINPDFGTQNVSTTGSTSTSQLIVSNEIRLGASPGTSGQILTSSGPGTVPTWTTPGGSGTVTSVGLTLPSIFTVTGSPITTTGVLNGTLASQPAATVFAGPTGTAGAPTFRTLAATDIPDLDASKITTGILPIAQGGTGATTPGAALANLGAMNNTLNAGEIFVGNASDIATGVAVSGDATMSSAGTLTVGNNAINSAKILDGTIVNADVNAAAAISGTKVSPNFGAQLVQSSSGANISLGAGANLTGINVLVPGTSGNSTGIISMSNGAGAVNYGIRGVATNGGTNYGLYGDATGASGSNYGIYARATNGFAGFFEGNMGLIGGLGLGGTPDFGVAGQVLTSAGPGTTPAWSTIAGGGSLQSAYDGGNTIVGTNAIDMTVDNGLVAKGEYSTGSIPATGAGVRMMFYPGKAAFRVGRTFNDSGTESANWDDGNIGDDSFAAGQNTVASGIRSFAVGKRATASGSASVAMGDGTTASRFGSVAMGFVSEATGQEAFAVGRYSQAEARASVAMGHYNIGGGDPTAFIATDPLFELGNGTDVGVNRSNAFTVLRNGKTSINGASPSVTLEINGTDAVLLPVGTDAQRPSIAAAGHFRYNATGGILEYHNGGGWQSVATGAGSPLINNTGTRNLFAGVGVAAIGTDNAVFGHQAGQNNSTYNYSVVIGTQAGFNKQGGSLNTLVGYRAGYGAANWNAGANTFIGADAGFSVTTGNVNTFIGEKAGELVTTSTRNVMIGKSAGDASTTGAGQNVFIGNDAANTNEDGSSLTIIGTDADVSVGNLTNSTAIGSRALVSQSNSIVLGSINGINGASASTNVGIGTTTPQGKLHIVHSDILGFTNQSSNTDGTWTTLSNTATGGQIFSLISSGPSNDEGAGKLLFSKNSSLSGSAGIIMTMDWTTANVGIGRSPATNRLEVEGDASKTTATAWLANSDKRIKTDINDIDNSFELIKKLRPVKFKYTEHWKSMHPSIEDRYYYNFIAQEFQEVFPDAVQESGEFLDGDNSSILQIDTYSAQIAAIKAVQELIIKVEQLVAENQKLKSEKGSLESKVSEIEAQQQELSKSLEEIKKMLGAQAKK